MASLVASGLAPLSFSSPPKDKPPNNKACFRWATTSEFRCMERLAPFWSGWGFCGELMANKSAVAECDADSLEYPCDYANWFEYRALADKTKMRAGTCMLEACTVENHHTDMDCLNDCPKWESSVYYSPTYNAQCEAFFDENHPCGKRCFRENPTVFHMFQLVCTVCTANPDRDCAFCPPDVADDTCYPLEWCPAEGSIFANPPKWTEIFPESEPDNLECTEEQVCEVPGTPGHCDVEDTEGHVSCHASQG